MTTPPKRTATQSDYIKTAIRFPPDLHTSLREDALRHGRTLNAQVIAKLQENDLAGIREELDEIRAMLRKILDAVT